MEVGNDNGNETESDLGIDTDESYRDLLENIEKKLQKKTEDDYYAMYLNNPNNAHLVISPWKRLPTGSVSHSTLWNKEKDCEEVVLFIGVCNFVYIQDGGNFNKVTWAHNEGASYLSITIDESTFFDEYRKKLTEWECMWKSGNTNLEWKSAGGLTFKVVAFKREEAESSNQTNNSNKRKRCEEEFKGNFLTSEQLSRCNRIQIVDEKNVPIDATNIENGDLVVVKCHVRYWRNLRKNAHGINKHLVGVKLLKKLEAHVSQLSTWQKDIF